MSLMICWGDKIDKNEIGGECSAYGGKRGFYRFLVGKPEGKRSLGRPRRRWGIILRWISWKRNVVY